MELKQRETITLEANEISFNRTFMELKLGVVARYVGCRLGFNRTFMELKQLDAKAEEMKALVLIGPSWN